MESRRELARKQIALMDEIRSKANVNIVTCGNCGTILIHREGEVGIDCHGCHQHIELSSCPDLWSEEYLEGSRFDEFDLVTQIENYLKKEFSDKTKGYFESLSSDEEFNDVFFVMVDAVRNKFNLGEDEHQIANNLVDMFIFNNYEKN